MTPPRLLILKKLLEPCEKAQRTLNEIQGKLQITASESIELKGFLVFLVAALETMLSDTYAYFVWAFPEAFDFKDVRFSKEEILGATLATDLIERQIEKNAIAQAYTALPDLLKTFTKTLSIAEPAVDEDLVDRVVEIKETRNILLHNDLRTNRLYLSRAGKHGRSKSEDVKLPLSRGYVEDACTYVGALVEDLRARMQNKYADFTRVAATRRLWYHLFSSPILKFDDYWIVDEAKDEISAMKEYSHEKALSSSEKALLAVWRLHFNGWKNVEGIASMYSLAGETRQKMLWFLAVLQDFRV